MANHSRAAAMPSQLGQEPNNWYQSHSDPDRGAYGESRSIHHGSWLEALPEPSPPPPPLFEFDQGAYGDPCSTGHGLRQRAPPDPPPRQPISTDERHRSTQGKFLQSIDTLDRMIDKLDRINDRLDRFLEEMTKSMREPEISLIAMEFSSVASVSVANPPPLAPDYYSYPQMSMSQFSMQSYQYPQPQYQMLPPTWSPQPSSYSSPPPQYTTTTSSGYHQQSQISMPTYLQQHQSAPHVFDGLPVKEEATQSSITLGATSSVLTETLEKGPNNVKSSRAANYDEHLEEEGSDDVEPVESSLKHAKEDQSTVDEVIVEEGNNDESQKISGDPQDTYLSFCSAPGSNSICESSLQSSWNVEVLVESIKQNAPRKQIQDIILSRYCSEGLSKHVDYFTKLLSLVSSTSFTQALVLTVDMHGASSLRQLDLLSQGSDDDFQSVLSEIEKEMSMSETMRELGYGCTASTSRCNEMLSHFLLLDEVTLSMMLGTIARIPIGTITSRTIQILKGHDDVVLYLQFSNNGKYPASSSKDKFVIIWDPGTVQTATAHAIIACIGFGVLAWPWRVALMVWDPGQTKTFSGNHGSLEMDDSSFVVCFGEMLFEFVTTTSGLSLTEVPAFKKAPGGAHANVAVGIALLGSQSAFMGKVSKDEFGYMLDDILKENIVNNQGVNFDTSADMLLKEEELGLDIIWKAKILSIWDSADIIKISEEEIFFLTEGGYPYDDAVVTLEATPLLLAQNCRLNVIRIMSVIHGKHANGENVCVGIDRNTCTSVEMKRMIWDPGINNISSLTLGQGQIKGGGLLCAQLEASSTGQFQRISEHC